jgi:CPA2 family monovalent cation:H+ antiporter-2
VSLKLLPVEGQSLVVAGSLISIALNPLMFNAIEPLQRWIRSRSQVARAMERSDDPLAVLPMTVDEHRLTGHVLLVGYGRVGKRIADALTARGIPIVVAEQNREIVTQLRDGGTPAVCGDASHPEVIIQAHVARARMVVIAVPDTFAARKMMEIARTLRPDMELIVRAHSDDEAVLLQKEGARVFMGEHELATAMTSHIVARVAGEIGSRAATGGRAV